MYIVVGVTGARLLTKHAMTAESSTGMRFQRRTRLRAKTLEALPRLIDQPASVRGAPFLVRFQVNGYVLNQANAFEAEDESCPIGELKKCKSSETTPDVVVGILLKQVLISQLSSASVVRLAALPTH